MQAASFKALYFATHMGQFETYTWEANWKTETRLCSQFGFSTLGLILDICRLSGKFGICKKHSSYNTNSSVVCRFWSPARSQQLVWALVSEMSLVQLFSRGKDMKIHRKVKWIWVRTKHRGKVNHGSSWLEMSRHLVAVRPVLVAI